MSQTTNNDDALISILQTVDAATLENKFYDWSNDKNNGLYYQGALNLGISKVNLETSG